MQHQFGEVTPAEPDHRQVLHDQRVGPQLGQLRQKLRRLAEFGLLQQRVERQVDPASPAVRIIKQPPEVGGGKVGGPFAGVEFGEPAVDGVGSGVECGQRGFQISGGSQQLRHGRLFVHTADGSCRCG